MTDHAKKFGHVSSITRLGWLRQCLAERSLLPVKAEHALSAQALGSMMARQKAAVERAVPDAAPQSTQAIILTNPTSFQDVPITAGM